MRRNGNQIQFSPSDLMMFMQSPFASWMNRFKLEYPDKPAAQDKDDELSTFLQNKGYAHENNLKQLFIDQGKHLKVIGDAVSQRERHTQTIAAMQEGFEVIFQARLEEGQFGGYADFLVKVEHQAGEAPSLLGDWHYEIWDTKLASKVKPTFIVQLCCYAQMLESIQGMLPTYIKVALGNGQIEHFRVNEFYCCYLNLKRKFLDFHQNFNPNNQPDPADSSNWGNWSDYAQQLLLNKDHLFQVANITRSQIKKLNSAGIYTLKQLAQTQLTHIKDIQPSVLNRLKQQALIQLKSREKLEPATANTESSTRRVRPGFEILMHEDGEKVGLALLPPHSPMDVFFDIEGYPLDEGGLEYLWGNTYFDEQGNRQFKDFWAHNPEQEKQCFQDFINWVYARWLQDPSMHIYHYASYEITACRKLMGRYGVCEHEVDQLLRNEVFVDLYKVVKGGIRIGEPRYSIKNVELLYRDKRDTEVGSGGDSIVVYDNWRSLHSIGEEGDTWETSEILNSIRNYNIDDCNSTQELVDWLREQQAAHNIKYLGKIETVEFEPSEEVTEVIKLRDRLLEQAAIQKEQDEIKARLIENLAWMLEFHRRELKPMYWRLFDRLGADDTELFDDLDCLALCERTEREPFKSTPRARHLSYEYRFNLQQEFKGLNGSFYLLGVESDEGRNVKVSLEEKGSDIDNGILIVKAGVELPKVITLIPDEFVSTKVIEMALFQIVNDYEQGMLSNEKSAVIDFLTRSHPRIESHSGGDLITDEDSETKLNQVIDIVKRLDNSYLTIQGPPGAGKTYTGSRVIAELLRDGAKVGISSNSHKAINNLLLSTAKYCQQQGIVASFYCAKETDDELKRYDINQIGNSQILDSLKGPCVFGTTAWGFCRDELSAGFDYLFIDEAGQVSTANFVAMSRCAKNLILMGDQMQLGQPSQGTHPAESGLSVLDYMLHDTPTIDADIGVFLDTTYRMHSKVNEFISSNIYAGKLRSNVDNDNRYLLPPTQLANDRLTDIDHICAGIVFMPVEHQGNTQASDEEVEVIVEMANKMLARQFATGEMTAEGLSVIRSIGWSDMLFVAPYNHQVSKLKAALGPDARVGSVDKFQGQEAAIVFLSMCASDANESPRGIDFLFNKNRLNVALSRAQILAIVVGSPDLGDTAVNSVEHLRKVNLYNAIMQAGSS